MSHTHAARPLLPRATSHPPESPAQSQSIPVHLKPSRGGGGRAEGRTWQVTAWETEWPGAGGAASGDESRRRRRAEVSAEAQRQHLGPSLTLRGPRALPPPPEPAITSPTSPRHTRPGVGPRLASSRARGVPAQLSALSERRPPCHLTTAVSRSEPFPDPMTPREAAQGLHLLQPPPSVHKGGDARLGDGGSRVPTCTDCGLPLAREPRPCRLHPAPRTSHWGDVAALTPSALRQTPRGRLQGAPDRAGRKAWLPTCALSPREGGHWPASAACPLQAVLRVGVLPGALTQGRSLGTVPVSCLHRVITSTGVLRHKPCSGRSPPRGAASGRGGPALAGWVVFSRWCSLGGYRPSLPLLAFPSTPDTSVPSAQGVSSCLCPHPSAGPSSLDRPRTQPHAPGWGWGTHSWGWGTARGPQPPGAPRTAGPGETLPSGTWAEQHTPSPAQALAQSSPLLCGDLGSPRLGGTPRRPKDRVSGDCHGHAP